MDILIMLVILATAVAVFRGARSGVIVALWAVGIIATLLLFHYHVTSKLDLSF